MRRLALTFALLGLLLVAQPVAAQTPVFTASGGRTPFQTLVKVGRFYAPRTMFYHGVTTLTNAAESCGTDPCVIQVNFTNRQTPYDQDLLDYLYSDVSDTNYVYLHRGWNRVRVWSTVDHWSLVLYKCPVRICHF